MSRVYASTISNDDSAALPVVEFEGQIIVITSIAELAKACKYLVKYPLIGFDTETRPSFTKGVTNRVALLQLSAGERCYLIRVNQVPMIRPLIKILESPIIEKVGVGVHGDILGLCCLRHFKARGFVELQEVVKEYGIEDLSLKKISSIVLGKKISKAQRLSNWEAKYLTQAQCVYAATDAWACTQILTQLRTN